MGSLPPSTPPPPPPISQLAYIMVLAHDAGAAAAMVAALAAAASVGVFNAALIAGLRIPAVPRDARNPVHRPARSAIGHRRGRADLSDRRSAAADIRGDRRRGPMGGRRRGLFVGALLARSVFGRRVLALSIAPAVARYSGLPVRRDMAWVMVVASLIAGTAGVVLSSSVRSYAPLSGNAIWWTPLGRRFSARL